MHGSLSNGAPNYFLFTFSRYLGIDLSKTHLIDSVFTGRDEMAARTRD